jgi:hypothetical protein
MYDLKELSGEEIHLLDRIVEGWETYGPALRDKLAIHGNVTWKTAKGAQYLVRYYRDDMGVLVNKSLGRRSPETEGIFEEFRKRRETARRTVAEGEASMALVGRLAKAHGLARMPAKHAEIVRAFWRESLDDQMMLFCGASLFAYEREGRVFAPSELVKDDGLTFVLDPRAEHIALDVISDAYQEALGVTTGKIGQTDGRITLTCAAGPGVEFVNERWLLDRVEDHRAADVLSQALREPAYRGMTIARDSRPVEIRTLDPRAYAMACGAMDDEEWTERGRFMTAVVRQAWGFDEDQESVLTAYDPDGRDSPPRM